MPEEPTFREAGSQLIHSSLDAMLSHVEGVRRAEDPEEIHDMRVASRRLRAALAVFQCAYSHPEMPRFEREVKAITDSLSLARDLDVMAEGLLSAAADLPPEERTLLNVFASDRLQERAKQQKRVEKALARLEKQDLARLFGRIAGSEAAH